MGLLSKDFQLWNH